MQSTAAAPEFESPASGAIEIRRPARQSVPLVIASPHSGSHYLPDFLASAAVPLAVLRRAEDAFVDELFGAAPALGAPLIAARFPRSYVDANREAYELDPAMFEGPLPHALNHRTSRVAAGLGMIPRVAASGEAIYHGRVPAEEIERRLAACWRPYHGALTMLVEQTHRLFGAALLLDAHSMPSSASGLGTRDRQTRVDVVLGDNHGEACHPELVGAVEAWLRDQGLRLQRNQPYAGGFTTQRYGRPGVARHALQIEINRCLYMDEARHERLPTFGATERLIAGLLDHVGQFALATLLPRPLAAE